MSTVPQDIVEQKRQEELRRQRELALAELKKPSGLGMAMGIDFDRRQPITQPELDRLSNRPPKPREPISTVEPRPEDIAGPIPRPSPEPKFYPALEIPKYQAAVASERARDYRERTEPRPKEYEQLQDVNKIPSMAKKLLSEEVLKNEAPSDTLSSGATKTITTFARGGLGAAQTVQNAARNVASVADRYIDQPITKKIKSQLDADAEFLAKQQKRIDDNFGEAKLPEKVASGVVTGTILAPAFRSLSAATPNFAFGMLGALDEAGKDKTTPQNVVKAFTKGATLDAVFKGAGAFKPVTRAGVVSAATGAGALAEGADPSEALERAAVMAGLSLSHGGGGRVGAKEIAGAIKETISKGERYLKGKITPKELGIARDQITKKIQEFNKAGIPREWYADEIPEWYNKDLSLSQIIKLRSRMGKPRPVVEGEYIPPEKAKGVTVQGEVVVEPKYLMPSEFATKPRAGEITKGVPGFPEWSKSSQTFLKKAQEKPEQVQSGPRLRLIDDVTVKDIHGNKTTFKKGHDLSTRIMGGQVLAQDGNDAAMPKNQFEALKGKAVELGEKSALNLPEGLEVVSRKHDDKLDIKNYNETEPAAPTNRVTQDGTVEYVGYGNIDGVPAKAIYVFDEKDFYDKYGEPIEDEGNLDWERALSRGGIESERESPTKFAQYIKNRGDNYKETLVVAPTTKRRLTEEESIERSRLGLKGKLTPEEKQRYLELNAIEIAPTTDFKSSHWDEPNVVAHLLTSEYQTTKGEKVFNINETQSDASKEARRIGFATEPYPKKYINSYREEMSENTNRDIATITDKEVIDYFGLKPKSGLPAHLRPYVENWLDISLTQALKDAVESGAKYLSWDDGQTVKDRYDLSKHVDEVGLAELRGGYYQLIGEKNGDLVIEQQFNNIDKLQDYVGKDIAKKLIDQSYDDSGYKRLSGENLSIGAAWADHLYNRIIPKKLKEMTKKLGGRLVEIEINDGSKKQAILITPEIIQAVQGGLQPMAGGIARYYRGGGDGSMPKGVTAQEVVDYEVKELGNNIKVENGVDLKQYPSESLQWLSTTKKGAKQFGDVQEKTGNFTILAKDPYGGVLVSTKQPDLLEEARKYKTAEEFVNSLTKGAKKLSVKDRPTVYADDIVGIADGLKPYKTVGELKFYDDGSQIIAKKGNKEVGYIGRLSDTETDLAVAQEFQKQGFGKKLTAEFFDRYPEMVRQSGGFTPAGKATYKSQLTDIWNKAHGVGEQSLLEEARKYKTAEEWIRNLKSDEIVGYRYGSAPPSGRSYNTMTQSYEDGVSLASALGDREIGSFAVSGAKDRPIKYYKGVKKGFGGDNEHLIGDVIEISKKEHDSLVKSPSMLAEKINYLKEKLATIKNLRGRGYSPYNESWGIEQIEKLTTQISETKDQLTSIWNKAHGVGGGKDFKDLKLFHGSKGKVSEETKSFQNVWENDNQNNLLKELAKDGVKEAGFLVGKYKPNNWVLSDRLIARIAKSRGYDAVMYSNSDRPQLGYEIHDVNEGKFYAEKKELAELYAKQKRDLKHKSVGAAGKDLPTDNIPLEGFPEKLQVKNVDGESVNVTTTPNEKISIDLVQNPDGTVEYELHDGKTVTIPASTALKLAKQYGKNKIVATASTVSDQLVSDIMVDGKKVPRPSFRVDKINAPDDVINLMKEVAEKEGEFKSQRPTGSLKELQRLAKEAKITVDDLLDLPPGSIVSSPELIKANQIRIALAKDLSDYSKKIDTSVATPEELKIFKEKTLRFTAVMKTLAGMRTEASNIFRSFQIVNTPQDETALRELLGDIKRIDKDAAGDLEQFAKNTRKAMEPTTADKIWHLWYASILSGPLTHIKNITSNVVQLGLELGRISLTSPTEVPSAIFGLLSNMSQAGKDSFEAFTKGKISKLEDQKKLPVRFTGRFTRLLNVSNYVGNALEGVDTFFKTLTYGMDMRQIAFVEGKSKGLKGKKLHQFINERVQNPTEEMQAAAKEYMLYMTYQQRPNGILGVLAEALGKAARKQPALRLIVPFTRVVANVANNAIDWTPWGFARWGFEKVRDVKGQEDRWAKDKRGRGKMLGRALIGTLAMTAFAYLAAQKKLTGRGPSDPKKRKQMLDAGWRPHSFVFTDKDGNKTFVPYTYILGPAALTAAIPANFFDAIRYGDINENDALDRASIAILGSMRLILDMSFLNGISDTLSAIENYDLFGPSYLKRMMSQSTAPLVPNLIKQIDRYFDPTVYNTDKLKDYLLNSMRITSGLKPQINLLGDAVVGDKLTQFTSSDLSKDPVKRFLFNNNLFISVPNKNSKLYDIKKDEMREMTDDEMYNFIGLSGLEIRRRLEDESTMMELLDIKKIEDALQPGSGQEAMQDELNKIVRSARSDIKFDMEDNLAPKFIPRKR